MKYPECARRVGVCVVFACVYISPPMRGAADWKTIPDITLEAESNDNPSLNSDGVSDETLMIDQTSRLLADVVVRFRNEEPRGTLTFEPRVRRDAYADDEARDFESTDVFLRSNGEHRGQTVRVGYYADVARERLLGVEFLETLDPTGDDPSRIATTQIGANERLTRLGIAPYVAVVLSDRGSLQIDGRLIDVDYARGATAGRTDFLERAIGGLYRRELGDERGALGVRAFATGYEASLNNNTTDTRGVELIYDRAVTELWSWSISGGTQRSDFALSSGGRRIRGTDSTPIFAIGAAKRGEQSSMRAELARRLSPDALGFIAPRDELWISWQRTLSARVNGRIVLQALDAEGVPTIDNSDRRYGRADFDIEWQVNPLWWFIAGYAHSTARTSATADETADSNALTIGIRYRGRASEPGAFAR